uniref:Uncharacterized protein n=1 Tax=Dulem virus 94 TaxID=3145805 RepID=A0AAU8AX97_9VIRU
MSSLKEDVIEIEGILDKISDCATFDDCKDPVFLTEKCLYEQASERLARQQFVCMQMEKVCQFHFAKMIALVKGVKLPEPDLAAIDEKIAVFEERMRKGEYSKW